MKRLLAILLLTLCLLPLKADEGMWMVNSMSDNFIRTMQKKGLKINASKLYDADSDTSISSAIVSLDFIGTGSMISPNGLLITNHHCAYSDVFSLSTAEHNYLENGFWASCMEEEIRIPGKTVQFLRSIVDVSDEVEAFKAECAREGKPAGMRKISYVLEKRWSEKSGLQASLSSMWAGSRYYMSLYEEYSDVRLVAAPPVSIAAFGGDIDNWEWPQHKGDFALYRVYDSEGKPVTPHAWLPISTKGYRPGSFTMVMGFPGRTDRYASSAKVAYMTEVALPISNKVRADQMEIIRKWMDSDPSIRLKYSDKFFSLSNVQELQEGEVDCCKRFAVVEEKREMERSCLCGCCTVAGLDSTYNAIKESEKNLIWYKETLVRGSAIALIASRLKNNRTKLVMEKEYSGLDLRVEKDLFKYAVEQYCSNVDSSLWGPYQKKMASSFAGDWNALADSLWTDEYISKTDPIFLFLTDVSMTNFTSKVTEAQGNKSVSQLNKEYTQSLWRQRCNEGINQYPDANSTLRLTYGCVSTFERDGKNMPWQTFTNEILEKENPESYDFRIKAEWKENLKGLRKPLPVNFITDNDITGGNSGSPVLNGKGEVIGLAFDGNKESLAGNYSWTEGYNKCICVDIRYVLWIISKHNPRLLREIK